MIHVVHIKPGTSRHNWVSMCLITVFASPCQYCRIFTNNHMLKIRSNKLTFFHRLKTALVTTIFLCMNPFITIGVHICVYSIMLLNICFVAVNYHCNCYSVELFFISFENLCYIKTTICKIKLFQGQAHNIKWKRKCLCGLFILWHLANSHIYHIGFITGWACLHEFAAWLTYALNHSFFCCN